MGARDHSGSVWNVRSEALVAAAAVPRTRCGRALTRRGRCRCCAAWRPVRLRGFRRRASRAGQAGCAPGNPAAAAILCQPPPTPGARAVKLVFCSFETRSLCVTQVRLEGTVAQDVLEHAAMLLPPRPTLQTLLLALGQSWESCFIILFLAGSLVVQACLALPLLSPPMYWNYSEPPCLGLVSFHCTTFKGINFLKMYVYVLEEGRAVAGMWTSGQIASDSSCLPPRQEWAHFCSLRSPPQCPRSPLSDLNNILKAGCKIGPGFPNLFLLFFSYWLAFLSNLLPWDLDPLR